MDEKFIGEGANEPDNNGEFVLFNKAEEAVENASDEVKEAADETADSIEEAVSEAGEAVKEAEEAVEEAIDTAKTSVPLVEKKIVEAPAKSKGEKMQSAVFFIIIGIGVLAFIILIGAGIFTMGKRFGWFDKSNDNEPVIESTEGDISGADNDVDTDVTESEANYSLYLDGNGFIKGVKAADYVKLCDYNNLTIDYAELKPSDAEIEEQISSVLNYFKDLSTDEQIVTKLGDTVNIDYVGKVDGVAFAGGDTQGNGADLELGSRSYIDDFEEQLVGYKPGDTVTVEVTFPENYGNEELNGKDAVFEVVINGVYVESVFDDAFVQKNLSDFAETADGYREYVENYLVENKKNDFIWNYIVENSEIIDYPEDYYQNEYSIYKLELENQFNYYNDYYYNSTGSYMWNDIYEFYETDADSYEDMVKEYADNGVKNVLVAQAIAESEGRSVTDEDVLDFLTGIGYDTSSYESVVEQYGEGYLNQNVLYNKIQSETIEKVTIKK